MRKSRKAAVCMGMIAGMVLANATAAFAGTWRTGAEPNQNRWWYDFDNGSYAANGWQWIDGDNNGVAECYYFDAEGWVLTTTTTPDGYQVNADGAWTENGIVQTQEVQVQASQTQETQPEQTHAQADATVNEFYSGVYKVHDTAFLEYLGLDPSMETITVEVNESNGITTVSLNGSPVRTWWDVELLCFEVPNTFCSGVFNNDGSFTLNDGATADFAVYNKIN